MPVPTEQKVTALSRDFGSPRRLADLLGVDPVQVARWQHGEGIDEANAERVDLLELVMAALLRLYSGDAARRWLIGLNPNLGDRRPLDLIRRRQTRELLDAIAIERAGSFA
ncbi:antitoxin Xre/MbcA/ParS toxin-binding domain-containing protein [Mycobacterium sp. P7213]|uniref:antitoxin Xre/MbcA/ParS toxin-binding domain-containing protein n=1 Tax=Mycobacterium sp. P7213 TaxID=2478465 RepID=UPI000F62E2A7|nr:antitoxin Xre/MbcA/ParS toxin-binding domain-containing protein [Mycobacterium sp. P7213]